MPESPNNIPWSSEAFDSIAKASEMAFKDMNERSKKSGEVMGQHTEKVTKAYKKTAIESSETMGHFFTSIVNASDNANKHVADNANDMFNLHVDANKKTMGKFQEHAKGFQTELSASAAATNVTMAEMIAAWTAKVTHTNKLVSTINEKSKDLSSSRRKGQGIEDHPFLEKFENIDKMSQFKPYEIMGSIADRAGANATTASLGELVALLGKIPPALLEIAPALGAFTGISAFIGAIVKELWELNTVRTRLSLEFGGDTKLVDGYISRMDNLVDRTHKTRDELIEMTESFQQVGIKVTDGGKDIDDFLVLASDMNRVLGVSNEQMADITKSQMMAGKSAEETRTIYSDMYVTMQTLGLTFKDFQAALKEGGEAWRSYGAVSGASMDQVQDDVMNVSALFKSLNINVRDVGSSLASLAGDQKKQNRQAMFISNMLGVDARSVISEQFLHPEAYQKDLLRAQGRYQLSNKNAQWSQNRDAVDNMGTMGAYSVTENRMNQLRSGSAISGMDSGVINQLMDGYQAWVQKNPGHDIDDFINQTTQASQSKGAHGTLNQAGSVLNGSWQEMANQLGREIAGDIKQIAHTLDALAGTLMPNWISSFSGGKDKLQENSKSAGGAIRAGTTTNPGNTFLGEIDPSGGLPSGAPGVSPMAGIPNISNSALDKYRAAQGMKKTRNWDPEMMQNAGIVMQEALRAGADPATAIATMLQESAGNKNAHGDWGYFGKKGRNNHYYFSDPHHHNPASESQSGGLFQLFSHGKASGMSQAEIFDPRMNARRAIAEMATLRKKHPDWSAGHIAAASQRPADQDGYRRNIDAAILPIAKQIVDLLQKQTQIAESSDQHLAETKQAAKAHVDQQRKVAMIGTSKNTTSTDLLNRRV